MKEWKISRNLLYYPGLWGLRYGSMPSCLGNEREVISQPGYSTHHLWVLRRVYNTHELMFIGAIQGTLQEARDGARACLVLVTLNPKSLNP